MKFIGLAFAAFIATIAASADAQTAISASGTDATLPAAPTELPDSADNRLRLARAIVMANNPATAFQLIFDQKLREIDKLNQEQLTILALANDQVLQNIYRKFTDDRFRIAADLAHSPKITDAVAESYADQFSVFELRDILAFARTPAGAHFFGSEAKSATSLKVITTLIGLMAEVGPRILAARSAFNEQMSAYLKAHPEVLRKIANFQRPGASRP